MTTAVDLMIVVSALIALLAASVGYARGQIFKALTGPKLGAAVDPERREALRQAWLELEQWSTLVDVPFDPPSWVKAPAPVAAIGGIITTDRALTPGEVRRLEAKWRRGTVPSFPSEGRRVPINPAPLMVLGPGAEMRRAYVEAVETHPPAAFAASGGECVCGSCGGSPGDAVHQRAFEHAKEQAMGAAERYSQSVEGVKAANDRLAAAVAFPYVYNDAPIVASGAVSLPQEVGRLRRSVEEQMEEVGAEILASLRVPPPAVGSRVRRFRGMP